MSLTEPDHPPMSPAAPPMQPGPTSDRSTWPSVLGTIAIIFGAGGLLSGVFSIVAPSVMEAFVSSGPGSPSEVSPQVISLSSTTSSAAQEAGILVGDVIEAVEGRAVTMESLIETIHASPNSPLTLRIRRDGARQDVVVTPRLVDDVGLIGVGLCCPESVRARFEVMNAWLVWNTLMALLCIGAAGLLLAGGILLIKRRARAINALKIWAALRIPLVVASGALVLVTQNALREVREVLDAPSVPFAAVMAANVFWLVFGCALPVFVLIWFARERVKTEIRRWT